MGCGVLGVDVAEEKTCEDKCKDICPACLDVKSCTENQIDCGPGPPSENPFCDPERICVPINCNCK